MTIQIRASNKNSKAESSSNINGITWSVGLQPNRSRGNASVMPLFLEVKMGKGFYFKSEFPFVARQTELRKELAEASLELYKIGARVDALLREVRSTNNDLRVVTDIIKGGSK